MPKYNKKCRECGHVFEEIRSYEEDHTKSRCPSCHSRNVKNIINLTPVTYNDEGFTKKTREDDRR